MSVTARLLSESADELFELAPCGFLITGPDGTIARVNETFLAWTGYPREALLGGQRFQDLLTVPGKIFYETHYAPLLRMQGWIKGIALDVARPGGEPLPVLVNAGEKRDAAGHPLLIRVTVFDATDRRTYERELLQARRRAEHLAAVVQSSHEPILIVLPDGRIDTWNTGAERLFGYSAAEAIGRTVVELIVPADRTEEHARTMVEARAGRPVQLETVRRTREGRAVHVLLKLTPYMDAGGNVGALAAVVQDMTARREAEQRLRNAAETDRAAREEAERVGRIKDEFLATLSHELRTPLNAILGWTQVLQGTAGENPDLQEALEVIERNTRVQSQLVDELLDMSRIISGKMRLDVQQVDLAKVVAAAVETARPAAEARSIRVQTILDPNVTISGDPGRLQQVFWNLLSNAAKFTPKGGLIRVVMQRINSHVEVSVVDNGQGMTREFLAVAFERFRQADSAVARMTKGLGLGLSIVKNLVEMHGGSIQAHSEGEGKGSTFTVSLPVVALQQEEAEAQRSHPRGAVSAGSRDSGGPLLAGVRVLVVDDEGDAREMVRRLLAGCDALVQTAPSAVEALAVIPRFRPDVLISDVGMPGEDGYAFIQRVRMLGPEAGGNVHAIALTAFARLEDRTRALMAGFQMHLPKPVDARELLITVASLAGRAGAVRRERDA